MSSPGGDFQLLEDGSGSNYLPAPSIPKGHIGDWELLLLHLPHQEPYAFLRDRQVVVRSVSELWDCLGLLQLVQQKARTLTASGAGACLRSHGQPLKRNGSLVLPFRSQVPAWTTTGCLLGWL